MRPPTPVAGSPGRAARTAAAWVALALPLGAAGAPEYKLSWKADPNHPDTPALEVAGAGEDTLRALQQTDWSSDEWSGLLSVQARPAGAPARSAVPAMLGRYSIEDGLIRFRPQFPLDPGVTYRAIFRPPRLPGGANSGPAEVSMTYRPDPPSPRPGAATVVAAVYPSGEVLPENLLKFYLHFSAPMQRGHVYEHIHLLDPSGKPVELPFLELDEELWNPEMTRLTLFIDPGRIKRGVLPLEEIGPSLESGKNYAFLIDAAWRDSRGQPLGERFRKPFRVGPPDREPPNPADWKITPPGAGTRDPLSVRFPEPMDHALALRMIRVADAAGETVQGTGELSDHEQCWRFTPSAGWRSGKHQLRVQKTIEDLAGNNIGKPFEVDLFEKVEKRFRDEVVTLPFEVR